MNSWDNGIHTPRVEETTLKTAEIQVERKRFDVILKENPRGKFVRIIEVGPKSA